MAALGAEPSASFSPGSAQHTCTRPRLGAEREPEVLRGQQALHPEQTQRAGRASGGLGCRKQTGRQKSVPQRRPVLTPEGWAEGWPPKCLRAPPQKLHVGDLMSQRVLSRYSQTEDSETGVGPGFPGGTPEIVRRYLFCLRLSAKPEDVYLSAGPRAPRCPY